MQSLAKPLAIYNPGVYFNEYVEALAYVLRRRGYEVTVVTALPLPPNNFYIMFGLCSSAVPAPNTPYIAVQLEQTSSMYFTPAYIEKLRGAVEVWDFSASSISFLDKYGIKAHYVPLGKVPTPLTPLDSEAVDVVFLGVINPHRKEIIEKLTAAGIEVKTSASTFGSTKAQLISRARIVLNLHYYPDATLEQLRVLPALASGKLVISETSRDQQPMAEFGTGADEILALCQKWLRVTPAERQKRALELLAQIRNFNDIVPVERIQKYVS